MTNNGIERAHIAYANDFERYIMDARCKFGGMPATVLVHLDDAVNAATIHQQRIEALQ